MNQEYNSVDEELLLEFFKTFAKFEFALKASPFRCERGGGVEPDWESFIDSIADVFNKNANHEIKEACDYILNDPPKRQVLKNNKIVWVKPNCPQNTRDKNKFLLKMVKQIRNNLFHGGKHDSEFPNNSERKTILLKSGLTILSYCLSLNDQLDYYFKDAHI